MSQTANSWHGVIEQVFDGFLWLDEVSPDWLEAPGIGARLSLDILYPELGIAFWFNDSRERLRKARPRRPAEMMVSLCRQAGISLVVVEGRLDAQNQTWAGIRTALSASARRIVQQRGAQEAKRDLLPRIAAAKATCQRIQANLISPRPERERGKSQQGSAQTAQQPPGQGWQVSARDRLAAPIGVLGAVPVILKRLALFVAVLLAVNAASYLVANFLDLRGPMAYNYVPDTVVPIADVIAPYPEYLQNVLRGDFGMMRLNELRGMLFAQSEVPILDLILQRLPRSLVLLGLAVTVAIVVGLTAGLLSVNYKTQRTNPLALIISLAGFSMPGFYVGILIVYLMIWAAMNHGKGAFFLPTTGYGIDRHLILPVLALAVRPTAEIARLTAELLGEELPKDYIRVARAKGLPEQVVRMRHAFRNVVAAVINAMSNSWSYVIGSLVIIERVFAWGGIGEALIDSVTFSQFAGSSFNPALVATLATATALLFLITDLVTGLLAQALDPRLRSRGATA